MEQKITGVPNSEICNDEIFYLSSFEKCEISCCDFHDYVFLDSDTSQAIQLKLKFQPIFSQALGEKLIESATNAFL